MDKDALTLRIHLVRHGQTHGNVQEVVLGQIDNVPPLTHLTELGQRQAQTTGRLFSDQEGKQRHHIFGAVYSSDITRAHQTAEFIASNLSQGLSEVPLILDARLRERAKGWREGRPKVCSQQEAHQYYLDHPDEARPLQIGQIVRQDNMLKKDDDNGDDVPLNESEEEVWHRWKSFLDHLCKSFIDNAQVTSNSAYKSTDISTNTTTQQQQNHTQNAESPLSKNICKTIIVVSHAAAIRVLLVRVINYHMHQHSRDALIREEDLVVPNASISRVDLILANHDKKDSDPLWTCASVELPSVNHLQECN